MISADTITDEQIKALRVAASDHAVTVLCRKALVVAELRSQLDIECVCAAEADPTGGQIEHIHHNAVFQPQTKGSGYFASACRQAASASDQRSHLTGTEKA